MASKSSQPIDRELAIALTHAIHELFDEYQIPIQQIQEDITYTVRQNNCQDWILSLFNRYPSEIFAEYGQEIVALCEQDWSQVKYLILLAMSSRPPKSGRIPKGMTRVRLTVDERVKKLLDGEQNPSEVVDRLLRAHYQIADS